MPPFAGARGSETQIAIDIRGEGVSLLGRFPASRIAALSQFMVDCIEAAKKQNQTPEYEI